MMNLTYKKDDAIVLKERDDGYSVETKILFFFLACMILRYAAQTYSDYLY